MAQGDDQPAPDPDPQLDRALSELLEQEPLSPRLRELAQRLEYALARVQQRDDKDMPQN